MVEITALHLGFSVTTQRNLKEEIIFDVDIKSGDDIQEITSDLREAANIALGKDYNILFNRRWELMHEVKQLESKLVDLKSQWNALTAFLRTQGINPNIPDFPLTIRLLNPSTNDAENDDEDEEHNEE